MPSEGAPKQLSHYQLTERRDPGRSRSRWLDISGQNRLTSSALAERCWVWLPPASCFMYSSTMKMEAVRFSEISVNYRITLRNIPQDNTPHNIKPFELQREIVKYKLCQRYLTFEMFQKGNYI
jgi:hypothetical protein